MREVKAKPMRWTPAPEARDSLRIRIWRVLNRNAPFDVTIIQGLARAFDLDDQEFAPQWRRGLRAFWVGNVLRGV
jgi:hypothetical protein